MPEIIYVTYLFSANPLSVLRTQWLNNTTFFGLRGRQEHHDMLWGDLQLNTESNGTEYILFTERATKTRYGQENAIRVTPPRMVATPGSLKIHYH